MKCFFFQPYMTKYREPFFEDLQKKIEVKFNSEFEVICAQTPENFQESNFFNFKIRKLQINSFLKLIFFRDIPFNEILKKDNIVIHFGDFHYFSLYALLIMRCFKKIKLYLHGQGGYKKNNFLQKVFYLFLVSFSDGYICYNDFCAKKLKDKVPVFLHRKISFIDNVLYLTPVEKTNLKPQNRILFIGRIRPKCGLEDLLIATNELLDLYPDLKLDIIGGGDEKFILNLKSEYKFTVFHGIKYDEDEIKNICSQSSFGAYGGDAGLSVVHYMALALPVVVHADYLKHMGPEACYVQDGYNGLNFARNDILSLKEKIATLLGDLALRNRLAENSLSTFKAISKPTMADKLIEVIFPGN